MARYVARPMAADGSDATGSEAREATVAGDYVSRANFERYAFGRRSVRPGQYNLYLYDSLIRPIFLGVLYQQA